MNDLISRQAAIDAVALSAAEWDGMYVQDINGRIRKALEKLPSAQPEERTDKHTETHACDCISRKDAIRWIKTECNPYGKPTLDFESGKRVMKHLEQMPPAQPEQIWILCDERMPEEHEWIGTKKFGTTMSDEVYVTFENSKGERFTKHLHFHNGELSRYDKTHMDAWYKDYKPIAWMPLPEPYKEGGADVR